MLCFSLKYTFVEICLQIEAINIKSLLSEPVAFSSGRKQILLSWTGKMDFFGILPNVTGNSGSAVKL